jgi:hypothetical protein
MKNIHKIFVDKRHFNFPDLLEVCFISNVGCLFSKRLFFVYSTQAPVYTLDNKIDFYFVLRKITFLEIHLQNFAPSIASI